MTEHKKHEDYANILKAIDSFLNKSKPKYLYNSNLTKNVTQVLYSGPFWDNSEIIAAIDSLLTGRWLVAGEMVHKFERGFSKYFGCKHSHMVNSGSSANLILIAALKRHFQWKENDEIIVSPVGFPTTISVIKQNGLIPKFVDIEYNTLNFDVTKIESSITNKTRAIFVSPVLANPPDMDILKDIAEKNNLFLIGDSCDSLGTKWDSKPLTDQYIAWSSSFYPAHHITTGEGGMVCTNDPEIKKLFVSFSWWGRDCYCIGPANLLPCGSCGNRFDKWLESYDGVVDHKYVFNNMGYNLKPLDLQGAIGLEQLKKMNEIELRRKTSKKRIEEILLKFVANLKPVNTLPKADPSWFGTPFICENKHLKQKLVQFLEKNGVQTRNYFAGNILLHPGYKDLGNHQDYPNANNVLDLVFFLGASPNYDDNVFDYIYDIFENKWAN